MMLLPFQKCFSFDSNSLQHCGFVINQTLRWLQLNYINFTHIFTWFTLLKVSIQTFSIIKYQLCECRSQVIIHPVFEIKLCRKEKSWNSNHFVLQGFLPLLPEVSGLEASSWAKKARLWKSALIQEISKFFRAFFLISYFLVSEKQLKSWIQGGELKYRYLLPLYLTNM